MRLPSDLQLSLIHISFKKDSPQTSPAYTLYAIRFQGKSVQSVVTLFILLMKFFKFLHAVDQSLYTFFRKSIVARCTETTHWTTVSYTHLDVYKRQVYFRMIVFFAYPDNAKLDTIILKYTAEKPVYDFIAPGDGFGHTFWIVDQDEDIRCV